MVAAQQQFISVCSQKYLRKKVIKKVTEACLQPVLSWTLDEDLDEALEVPCVLPTTCCSPIRCAGGEVEWRLDQFS